MIRNNWQVSHLYFVLDHSIFHSIDQEEQFHPLGLIDHNVKHLDVMHLCSHRTRSSSNFIKKVRTSSKQIKTKVIFFIIKNNFNIFHWFITMLGSWMRNTCASTGQIIIQLHQKSNNFIQTNQNKSNNLYHQKLFHHFSLIYYNVKQVDEMHLCKHRTRS